MVNRVTFMKMLFCGVITRLFFWSGAGGFILISYTPDVLQMKLEEPL